MKKLTRTLAVVLCLCMAVTLVPATALAAGFSDTRGHWAESAIDRWSRYGIIDGVGNGDFNPDGTMTRAAAAKVISNLMNLTDMAGVSRYTDMDPSAWYVEYISKCVAAGVMHGTNDAETLMSPNDTVSREAMFVMIARALGLDEESRPNKSFADYNKVSSWAQGSINALINIGALKGTGNGIEPAVEINRASVMSLLDESIGTYAKESGEYTIAGSGKLTLLVHGSIVLKGDATKDSSVIVAGNTSAIDMADVKGTATLIVGADNVTITNAPEGTVINTTKDVSGVTVNDSWVDKDSQLIVPAPAPEEPTQPQQPGVGGGTGVGGGGGVIGGVGYVGDGNITSREIGEVIKAALTGPDGETMIGLDYGKIDEYNDADTVINVEIYNTSVPIEDVNNDVVGRIINALAGARFDGGYMLRTIVTQSPVRGTSTTDSNKKTTVSGIMLIPECFESPVDDSITTDIPGLVNYLLPRYRGNDLFPLGTSVADLGRSTWSCSFTVTDNESINKETSVVYTVNFKVLSMKDGVLSNVKALSEKDEDTGLSPNDLNYDLKVEGTQGLALTATIKNTGIDMTDGYNTIYRLFNQIYAGPLSGHQDNIYSICDVYDKDNQLTSAADLTSFLMSLSYKKGNTYMKIGVGDDGKRIDTSGDLNGTTCGFVVTYRTADNKAGSKETYNITFKMGTLDEDVTGRLSSISRYSGYSYDNGSLVVNVNAAQDATVGDVYEKVLPEFYGAFKMHAGTTVMYVAGYNSNPRNSSDSEKYIWKKLDDIKTADEFIDFIYGIYVSGYDYSSFSPSTSLSGLNDTYMDFYPWNSGLTISSGNRGYSIRFIAR